MDDCRFLCEILISDTVFVGIVQICKWDQPHNRGKHPKKPWMWQ